MERGVHCNSYYARGDPAGLPLIFGHTLLFLQGEYHGAMSKTEPRKKARGLIMTLEQACPPEYQGAQCAFKDLMIH